MRVFDTDVNGVKRVSAGSTTRIDLREQVLNFPSQPVITKDNVTIDIDAVIYYRVADPQKATYAVQNLPFALETLTRTTLRNIVGEMELDQTLVSRDTINKRMRDMIEEASIGWGVDVTRVELQAIEPPRDIQQSMELQMRAERERRAAVTNAEAGKRAAILEAEGVRESAVLRAQGMAEARLAMAQAEAETIGRIAGAMPGAETLRSRDIPAGAAIFRSTPRGRAGTGDDNVSAGGSDGRARGARELAHAAHDARRDPAWFRRSRTRPGYGGVPAPGSPWPPPPGLLGPGLGSGTTDGSGTASGKPPGSK